MAHDLSLDSLSTDQKLILMERLWEDLSQRPGDLPAPEWHGDILAERMASAREGHTEFVDWNEAKERLRDRLK